jgi:lipopolysaccharide export system protein LptA
MAPEPNREPTEELRGESDPTKLNNSGPISITADHMLADDKTREITFTGKVVARQGELIISCDRMRVSYIPKGAYERAQSPSTPSLAPSADPRTPATPGAPSGDSPLEGGQEIDQVNCQGAVKIQQGDRLAVGDSALYLAKALPRRLVLTGDARVWQGENSITGHQITYYLDENRSLVDSQGGGRVRAFYNQGASGRE